MGSFLLPSADIISCDIVEFPDCEVNSQRQTTACTDIDSKIVVTPLILVHLNQQFFDYRTYLSNK